MYEWDCPRSTNFVVLTNFRPEVWTRTKTSIFTPGSRFLLLDWLEIFWSYKLCIRYQKCTPPQNYRLVSMALSDVVTILLWPLYYFQFAKVACEFVALAEVSIMVSSNTLTVLAVERYHAILKPFETGLRLNKDKIKRAITCIWIASFVICFAEFFLKEWSETNSSCIGPWTVQLNEASKIYVIINLTVNCLQTVVMFSCPDCVIKGLYFSIIVYPETDRETTSEKKETCHNSNLDFYRAFSGLHAMSVVFLGISMNRGW